MPVTRRWTTADVRALTREDRPWPRYELIDGELLVTPAPRTPHQIAAFELCRALDTYLERERIGLAVMSPADLEMKRGTITQPDVFVIPAGIGIAGVMPEWTDVTSLLLAAEVLSPSSLRTDRIVKRDFYLANGVAEYWIVDLDERMIERWTPVQETPVLCRGSITWTPLDREPLVIDLDALFDRIEEKCRRIAR
ncbi:MAG: Uma2 family endonuclease [Gemmatimonadaceae bacterium]|nr:Uma2 family endonuclease [Gemmatimonadaceae bacterium]